MSAEERKALSFVAILLGLSVVARATARPDPVLVSGATTIDIQTRLQQNQQVRERVSVPARTRTTPRRKPPAAPPSKTGQVVIDNRQRTQTERRLIDLNRATAVELDALPGISPTVAERIVQFRTERGYLVSVEQLDSVKGIGPALLEKVRGLVMIR